MVENITDDILFEHLDSIGGVLVWPVARVTSGQEDQMLVEWVKRGNVLLLSGTVAFDSYLDEKSEDEVLLAAGLSAGEQLLSPKDLSLANGATIATNRSAEVGDVKVVNKKAKIFARINGRPIGVLSPVGKGWVGVAFGASSGMDYPTNVQIDDYLCELAKEVLRLAHCEQAAFSAPSGRLQFLATDGRYLNIFLPSGGQVVLSRKASAYDPSASHKTMVRFESMGGATVHHYPDRALITLPSDFGSATLKIIRKEG